MWGTGGLPFQKVEWKSRWRWWWKSTRFPRRCSTKWKNLYLGTTRSPKIPKNQKFKVKCRSDVPVKIWKNLVSGWWSWGKPTNWCRSRSIRRCNMYRLNRLNLIIDKVTFFRRKTKFSSVSNFHVPLIFTTLALSVTHSLILLGAKVKGRRNLRELK